MSVGHKILASLSRKPGIALQSVSKISDRAFSIICSVDSFNYTSDQLKEAVRNYFSGAFTVESSTLYPVVHDHYKVFRAIVAVNTVSHPFSEETVAALKMYPTTANTFLDEEDTIWNVVGEGDNRRLVQTAADNFDQLISSKKTRNPVTASFEDDHSMSFTYGDYVKFYNPITAQVDFGFALSNSKVFSRSQLQTVVVAENAVVDVADGEPLATDENNQFATEASADLAVVLDYWKKLYSNTHFYNKLESLMNAQARG